MALGDAGRRRDDRWRPSAKIRRGSCNESSRAGRRMPVLPGPNGRAREEPGRPARLAKKIVRHGRTPDASRLASLCCRNVPHVAAAFHWRCGPARRAARRGALSQASSGLDAFWLWPSTRVSARPFALLAETVRGFQYHVALRVAGSDGRCAEKSKLGRGRRGRKARAGRTLRSPLGRPRQGHEVGQGGGEAERHRDLAAAPTPPRTLMSTTANFFAMRGASCRYGHHARRVVEVLAQLTP